MALKVVSSYQSSKPLKVVSGATGSLSNLQGGSSSLLYGKSPNLQGGSAKVLQNPSYQVQQTAPASVLYNPKAKVVVGKPLPLPKITWDQAALDKQLVEQQIQRRRVADAKNNEIIGKKSNFLKTLGGKVSFEALRKQRGGRELAVKYWEENERVWGSQIMARQRVYESKGAQLKDWVMQAESEAEYNKRVGEANAWLDGEYNAITDDIKDYQFTQMELANYAETPLKGKFATAGRFGKDFVGGMAGQSWNALTWTASQPQRVVNTVKNFVKPDNVRQYYGGEEKKAPQDIIGKGRNPLSTSWDQLRKSYNESRNQRTVSYTKADEEARLKKIKEQWAKMPEGKNIFGDSTKSGFLRNGNWLEEARIKYGDDVVDMLADPMNFFAGAGSASKVGKTSKADRLLGFLGKNKFTRNAVLSGEAGLQAFKNSKIGQLGKKLNTEWIPRGEKARRAGTELAGDLAKVSKDYKIARNRVYDSFGADLRIGNKIKSDFLLKQASHSKRLAADIDRFKVGAEKLSQDFVKRLNQFSDTETRALTRFARNGEWSAVDKLKISKYRRADLTAFLDDYQVKARQLAKSEKLTNRAKNYLPEFTGRGYDPTKRRSVFGEKYFGQGKQQLQESIIMRDFVSNWDESNDFLKSLAKTEREILTSAKKTNRALTVLEKQQLDTIAQRRATIERLNKRYDKKFEAVRGAMSKVRQDAQPAIRFGKGGKVRTNFTKMGIKNTISDAYHLPMKMWKKSVLKYNPAWYVNNTMWNVPASVSAAGADVFSEYGKLLTNKKYWNEVRKNIPEGVMSKISQEIGKGGLASKIEDTSRLATFLALRKKGFTDEQALKQVNRWLFDYGTKNWERPIKGILPFWQWQKNIIRLGATMPFHSPRSAKVYSELYKQFYQRPYDALPSEVQEYTDPETGKTVKYDPRQFYKGKAKVGNNWYGLPFFAVNPETALQFGTNPYLLSGADYVTSTDRLGNKNTDRKASTILGERFPQVNLGRAQANRNNMDIDLWFSQSGNSKWAQGWDSSKSNYKLGLDNNRKFYNSLKSFFGVPRGVKFDKVEFDTKKRLTDFNKEFFATDWAAKEDTDYKAAQKEKEALAGKFGFDLQKDIYDNYWSKYDTATTSNTKKLKREAAQFNSPDSGWWRDYFALPAGTKTSPSQRRPFLIGKFDEWKRDHTFAKNPYYKLPKNGEINPFVLRDQENQSKVRRAEGKRKYQRKLEYEKAVKTNDWSFFERERKAGRFKSAESKAKYERGVLWREYYALDSKDDKAAFLAAHPEMQEFETPTTPEEWTELRNKLRAKRKANMAKITGFSERQSAIKYRIEQSVRTSFGRKRMLKFK